MGAVCDTLSEKGANESTARTDMLWRSDLAIPRFHHLTAVNRREWTRMASLP
jgi:hypothetical protein